MNPIHIGAASLNTTPKDWENNAQCILGAIADAKKHDIKLLCLPELCITGYGCEDDFHAPYLHQLALEILFEQIIPATADIAVTVGLPIYFKGAVFNTIAFICNQKLEGLVAKKHLAGDGIHYEPRFFKAWPADTIVSYQIPLPQLNSLTVPLGDLIFELDGVRIGFEICEDAWVATRPGVQLAQKGVHIILGPSASHFSFLKTDTRERFVVEGSRAFNCAYVYANLLGNEAGRAIYDGECLIAHGGELLSKGPRFNYHTWRLTSALVDIQKSQVQRSRIASYKPDLEKQSALQVDFNLSIQYQDKQQIPKVCQHTVAEFETSKHLKEEEFARAVALGLFDYMRKSHSRGFAVSLSGGADSAACAVLVHLMVKYVLQDNPEAFAQVTGLNAQKPLKELVEKLLTCIYQGTVNSSETTRNAAQNVARGTGARFQVFDVQGLVENYEKLLASYLDRSLTWEEDDIARQNIQARCRAPSIWAIANAEGYLLITTSNRSEAAVGYCTMDGDTAGSIAPIGGIDKDFLIKWLHWAEEEHVSELKFVNEQAPTAELRPQESKQTDEADLMPYFLLNFIQKLAVIDKLGPTEIFHRIEQKAHEDAAYAFSKEQSFAYLKKYFQLWSRNQWKRERYAPSFHVDDENLDPRSWCRFPILSGGYTYELNKLKEQLKID